MITNPKKQVILIALSTVLSAFSLAAIINFTRPQNASWLTFTSFYFSLFLLSLGIFTLLGLALRLKLTPGLYMVNLANSFRQALLLSVLVAISFFLLSQKLLFWWVEASLILFLAALETFLNLKV